MSLRNRWRSVTWQGAHQVVQQFAQPHPIARKRLSLSSNPRPKVPRFSALAQIELLNIAHGELRERQEARDVGM